MNVVRRHSLLVLSLLFLGCTKTVEVPTDQVATVIDPMGVRNEVLTEGVHEVRSTSDVVFFDISPREIEFSFEFIFTDASSGNVRFFLTYQPVADEMSNFLQTYETDNVEMVVTMDVRAAIRDKFDDFSRAQVNNEKAGEIISKVLNDKLGITKFIQIQDIRNVVVSF